MNYVTDRLQKRRRRRNQRQRMWALALSVPITLGAVLTVGLFLTIDRPADKPPRRRVSTSTRYTLATAKLVRVVLAENGWRVDPDTVHNVGTPGEGIWTVYGKTTTGVDFEFLLEDHKGVVRTYRLTIGERLIYQR